MNATQPPYNTAALRRLMLQAFSDEEFTIFCYDHFREVRQQFTTGMTFLAKVQLLIEHCERTNAFPHLLPLLAEANPAKYTEFSDSLQKPVPQPATGTQSAITNLQSPISSFPRQPFEPEMILIPSGEFLMGSDPRKDIHAFENEQPQHFLYLPNYYLAKTPITNVQYLAFIKSTGYRQPYHWQNTQPPTDKYEHPVVFVNWYDAVTYCDWLAEVTGKPYCLPSEAEWEKGARGTDGRIYPWGDEWDMKRCNSWESRFDSTTSSGMYLNGVSPYGLLDTVGNVWEWTRSLWGKDHDKPEFKYPYRLVDSREDLQADYITFRVFRGGSFNFTEDITRCAYRNWLNPKAWKNEVGFRVAISTT